MTFTDPETVAPSLGAVMLVLGGTVSPVPVVTVSAMFVICV